MWPSKKSREDLGFLQVIGGHLIFIAGKPHYETCFRKTSIVAGMKNGLYEKKLDIV